MRAHSTGSRDHTATCLRLFVAVSALASGSGLRADGPRPAAARFSTVDSSGFNARYVYSLCLDSKGMPHLLYQGFGQTDRPGVSGPLVHAAFKQGAWQKEVVLPRDPWSSVHGSMQTGFDSSGCLHCLYSVTGKAPGLMHGSKSAEEWTHRTVFAENVPEDEMKRRFGVTSPSLPLVNENFSMSVGGDDKVHICFLDPAEHVLWYGTKEAQQHEWELRSLEDVGPHEISTSRIWPAVAAGPRGKVFVTYKKYAQRAHANRGAIELRLATCSEKGWTFETVVKLGPVDGFSQLAADAQGRPRVVYTRAKPGRALTKFPDLELVHATKTQDRWEHETVLALPQGNGGFSLAVGPDARPRLLVNTLKHSEGKGPRRGDLLLLERAGAGWSTATLVRGSASSVAPQTAADGSGALHFAFVSAPEGKDQPLALRYGVVAGK